MKRSTIIGALALLTVASLGVATLAMVRRHRAEARFAEQQRTNEKSAFVQPQVVAHRTSAETALGKPAAALALKDEANPKPAARPDVGALFAAHPELQAAHQRAVSGRLHHIYDQLFGRLGLTSAQIDRAVALLVRDAEHELDLAMTAQALQLSKDDPSLREVRRGEKADTEAKLESLLGGPSMQAWRDYNRALGMQSTAEDVASLALATDAPITGPQLEQLTRVLAEASATYRSGGRPEWSTTDWSEVLRQASTFLTAPQVAVLEAKIQQAKAAALLGPFYALRPQR